MSDDQRPPHLRPVPDSGVGFEEAGRLMAEAIKATDARFEQRLIEYRSGAGRHRRADEGPPAAGDLRSELARVLNRASAENGSDTPDFILAQYLSDCLDAYDRATVARDRWHRPRGATQEALFPEEEER